MLIDSKSLPHISGTKHAEMREGCGGRGEVVFIVFSWITDSAGDVVGRSSHSERFADLVEAMAWYEGIN